MHLKLDLLAFLIFNFSFLILIEANCNRIKWGKFIILGDSNTQWLNKLANLFQRNCDIINRGFGGYNSTTLTKMLPQLLNEFREEEICGVLILIGTNDSSDETNKLQHVPINQYKSNLEMMVNILKKFGVENRKIIIVSPNISRLGDYQTKLDDIL